MGDQLSRLLLITEHMATLKLLLKTKTQENGGKLRKGCIYRITLIT